ADAAAQSDKPCLATFLGMRGVTEALSAKEFDERGRRRAVPAYSMPEDAVRALAAATKYGEWRARDQGQRVAPVGLDRAAAEALVDKVLAQSPEGRALTPEEVTLLLAAYGIPLWPTVPVATADEAVAAARQLGYPVVVKSVAPPVRHQPRQGGIRVDLHTAASVREAFAALKDRLAALSANSLVVQKMATPGVPCVVSTTEDPLFGPVVSFSVAGPPTELLGDIGHRIPPLTDVDVSDLISSVRAAPLLHGHRGATPVNRAALADLVARMSVLADELPEVASLVLNPVIAHPGGVDVVGAEATVAPPPVRKDTDRRALP
ncbi:MAG: acetate--CoA ligase family protein, partial [Oryzihumus sp.]